MTVSVLLRFSLAVIACAGVLVLTALYEVIFLPEWKSHELVETVTPSGQVAVGIAHLYRVPTLLESILRIATPLLALIFVAGYFARLVPNRKVWSGAIAAMCAALITLVVLQSETARRLELGYWPWASTFAIWAAVSLSIGAAASWALGVWWPNKSLERTRER
jgi:hypothetical protein